jgi:long-chain acyl-CoA synthetase
MTQQAMKPTETPTPMQPMDAPELLYPSRVLAGKTLVVVGGTGFLGKVWVALLLCRFPEIRHLYLVVRPKANQTAQERFWSQIASSPVFDPLRELYPGAAFEAFLRDKVTPIGGDVVGENLNLPESLLAELSGQVDAVVNVAGVVDFNPPLDEALDVNAFGVQNLVSLARRLGHVPVMHTSTCYVVGGRAGLVEELDPRVVPFPRAPRGANEAWLGGGPPDRELDRAHWDPEREIAECMDLVKQARSRCEDAFRQSAFLDEAKKTLEERGEPCRGTALLAELAKVKRKFIEDRLKEAGRERALFWGWPNIYTYTKSIGEQILASSDVPFTIVRPAVIESSCVFPSVGWNEGINTSAPFIYMAFKGQVQFPGGPGVHLDIIPCDMVASGMIASLVELIEGRAPAVYQYGSTDVNPCLMTRYLELIGLYKRQKVRDGKTTKVFDLVSAYIEPRGLSIEQYNAHGAHAIAKTMRGLGGLLSKAAVGPMRAVFKPAAKALEAAAKTEDRTGDIMDLFIPFTASTHLTFSCENTRRAMARMPPEERARFFWEPEKLDWREWMYEVHLPGLEKWVVPLIEEKMKRETKPLRRYDTLVDLLDEVAERHDHAVALQHLEADGPTRLTYRALRAAAHAAAARLVRAGVASGDRVLLSGHNSPSWTITYFGILVAGAVVVPVDPALEGPQLINVLRSSGARVAVWGIEVEAKGGRYAREKDANVRVFDLAAMAEEPGSDEAVELVDRFARAPRPASSDLASIIYTSGTTGDPKGVMLSHQNFTALIASLAPVFPLNVTDRVLSVLPLHHTFEFTCGLLLPLSRGARILYLDELNADRLSQGLKQGRITAMVGVPALWQMLERRIVARVREHGPHASTAFNYALEVNRLLGKRTGVDLGRLFFGTIHDELGGHIRHVISGGAALPKDTAKLFAGMGLPLSEGYGLTEAAPVVSVSRASLRAKPGQVGKALPGVEIEIRNPDSQGIGEIVARGPNVMVGYADDPEATADAIDEQGWLKTGDLGKFDSSSRLVIVGRHKDVIVGANGENVYPDDVENLLGEVAFVKELAIVGVDDGRGGERVGCLAVPEAAADESGAARAQRHEQAMTALRAAIQKLPRGAQPALVHLYDADLPRTATKKVKRSEVKTTLLRLESAASLPPVDGEVGNVEVRGARHAIATIANQPIDTLRSAMSLKNDLGFDSLMAMELSVALDAQVGRPLDAARLAACETVSDIEALMAESLGARAQARTGRAIEKKAEEPLILPAPIADAVKRAMTTAQLGFYDRVMRPKVYGRSNIPHNRNAIVVSNHSSHLDMGFVKYALGEYGRDIVALAAQDYFFEGNRLRRAYVENLTNLAPFDRKNGLRGALRQSGDVLESGATVLIFPEGTRSPDGAIREFKPAIGHLALTHGVDILPIYLGGTREAMPKGSRLPTKRSIVARIGLPLEVEHLRRLTESMRFSQACRKVAELAHSAVIALRDGGVLDLSRMTELSATSTPKEHPLAALFRELQAKFEPGRVTQPITYYFTLGADNEAKWTLSVRPDGCDARLGKPEGAQADCVLKTTPEIFIKICREAYTPSPMEFMTGQIKSNDISLLQTFQKVFDLA